jgi:hypothetical protein
LLLLRRDSLSLSFLATMVRGLFSLYACAGHFSSSGWCLIKIKSGRAGVHCTQVAVTAQAHCAPAGLAATASEPPPTQYMQGACCYRAWNHRYLTPHARIHCCFICVCYCADLLKRSEEKREERRVERLNNYYKRNFRVCGTACI